MGKPKVKDLCLAWISPLGSGCAPRLVLPVTHVAGRQHTQVTVRPARTSPDGSSNPTTPQRAGWCGLPGRGSAQPPRPLNGLPIWLCTQSGPRHHAARRPGLRVPRIPAPDYCYGSLAPLPSPGPQALPPAHKVKHHSAQLDRERSEDRNKGGAGSEFRTKVKEGDRLRRHMLGKANQVKH